MTKRTWREAIACETQRLAAIGRLPLTLHGHPALRAMGIICVLAAADLKTRQIKDSVDIRITAPRLGYPDVRVRKILRQMEANIAGPARGERETRVSFQDRLDGYDYDGLIAATIRARLPDEDRTALLREVAHAGARVTTMVQLAQQCHRRALIDRDLPALSARLSDVPAGRAHWLFAVDYNGRPERRQVLLRRIQALTAYAAVADCLSERPVTVAIDAGEPLAPRLTQRLGLSRAGVRALVGACDPVTAIAAWSDWQRVVAALSAHAVPPHEWPGGGVPNRPETWLSSPWLCLAGHRSDFSSLIRADFHGAEPARVRDAVEAFRIDLLRPLVVERLTIRGYARTTEGARFGRSLDGWWRTDERLQDQETHREFLELVRIALVGPRRARRFQEAVALWHRQAATVAAVRDERQTVRPGWPPLCPPWRSACGRYGIVALTSARALVAEGKTHQHCVGGYYDQCRLGGTQILSMRDGDMPVATIEVLLGSDWRRPHLTIGQFRGWHDEVPAEQYHPVLRSFLADLREGVHPIHGADLARYREWAEAHVTPWSSDALPLEHSRTVYSLYRPLLPRPVPETFDEWTTTSGLVAGLDVLIDRLFGRHAQSHVDAA